MLEVVPTALPEVLVMTTRWFDDARGSFSETYNKARFTEGGVGANFVQDNQVLSHRTGTLRGLHFQIPPYAQAKLVRVTRGSIFDVAVDIRPGSPNYGRWVGVELSAANKRQILVPHGFAHGYVTLEPDSEVLYKVDNYYSRDHEGGLLWNDPAIGIEWPLPPEGPLLADRDAALPTLAALPPVTAWTVTP